MMTTANYMTVQGCTRQVAKPSNCLEMKTSTELSSPIGVNTWLPSHGNEIRVLLPSHCGRVSAN